MILMKDLKFLYFVLILWFIYSYVADSPYRYDNMDSDDDDDDDSGGGIGADIGTHIAAVHIF